VPGSCPDERLDVGIVNVEPDLPPLELRAAPEPRVSGTVVA
jgi:hypothetical protein